jgi:hypothetical protein
MHLTFKQFLTEDLFSKKEVLAKGVDTLKELSKKLGVEYSVLKKMPLQDIGAILQYLGKHDYSPNSSFDPKQLKMGIKIEKEHTTNTLVAELIAKDHLAEDPKYYTKLKKMESGEKNG